MAIMGFIPAIIGFMPAIIAIIGFMPIGPMGIWHMPGIPTPGEATGDAATGLPQGRFTMKSSCTSSVL